MLLLILLNAIFLTSGVNILNTAKTEWNGLSVKFKKFNYLPQTLLYAKKIGFKRISKCDQNVPWQGARYVKGNNYALILLFDVNGYIAGMQTSFPKGKHLDGFLRETDVSVSDGDNYTLTTYFVKPDIICDDDFVSQGISTKLHIQTGNDHKINFVIPKEERELLGTKWVKGKCLRGKGTHYFYDISTDMDCNNFFPYSIVYNKGKLNGFSWNLHLLNANMNSPLYVKMPPPLLNTLFKKNTLPKCLMASQTMSSIHVYLTESLNTLHQKWDKLQDDC